MQRLYIQGFQTIKLGGDSLFLSSGPLGRVVLPKTEKRNWSCIVPIVATPLGIESLIPMCPIS